MNEPDQPQNAQGSTTPVGAAPCSRKAGGADRSPAGGQLRRRLLKAGAAAIPVVLTLRGRPLHAHTVRVSPDTDPNFFVTGHGLSHEGEPPDLHGESEPSPEQDTGWSEGPQWPDNESGTTSEESGDGG